MKRTGHFKAFELSDDARAIVHEGFLRHAMLKTIIARVQAQTGEALTPSALQRYRVWWRSEHRAAEEARQYAQEVAASLKGHPAEDVRKLIEQKIEQLFLLKLRSLEGQDPLAVADLALRQRKVSMRGEQLGIEREKVGLAARRLAALEAKLKAADAKVGDLAERRNLDPDTLKEIREIYGLGE